MKITIRRNWKVYITIVSIGSIMGFLAFAMSDICIDIIKFGVKDLKNYFAFPALIFVVWYGYISIYSFLKNSPTISVDENFISFNSKLYSWSEISEISLVGLRPFHYGIFSVKQQAAQFKFANGDVKYLFDGIYGKGWKVKYFVEQVVINKCIDFQFPLNEKLSDTTDEYYQVFKGNQLTSLRAISGYMFLAFSIFIVYTALVKYDFGAGALIAATVMFGMTLLHFYLMHYFEVSDNYLRIKNHNLLWINKLYRLSDIREVIFETQGNQPNSLRVITKHYKTKVYPAGTLREFHWDELKKELESKGVIVRNRL